MRICKSALILNVGSMYLAIKYSFVLEMLGSKRGWSVGQEIRGSRAPGCFIFILNVYNFAKLRSVLVVEFGRTSYKSESSEMKINEHFG